MFVIFPKTDDEQSDLDSMGDGGMHTVLKRKHRDIVREVRTGNEFTEYPGPEAERVRCAETQRLKDLRLAGTKGVVPKTGRGRPRHEPLVNNAVPPDTAPFASEPVPKNMVLRSSRVSASGLEEVYIVEDAPRRSQRIRKP